MEQEWVKTWVKTNERFQKRSQTHLRDYRYGSSNVSMHIAAFKNGRTAFSFNSIKEELAHALAEKQKLSPEVMNRYEQEGFLDIFQKDKNIREETINLIDKYYPFDEMTKREIFKLVGIFSVEKKTKEIDECLQRKAFSDAIVIAKEAQSKGFYDIPWQLIEKLGKLEESNKNPAENQVILDILVECCQCVSEKTPYFANAQKVLFELLLTQSVDKNDTENYFAWIENTFRVLINTNDQPLIDQYYHQLCGGKDMTPSIQNVISDAETLIAAAREMRKLRDQNEKLKAENISLEDKKSKWKSFAIEKTKDEIKSDAFSCKDKDTRHIRRKSIG